MYQQNTQLILHHLIGLYFLHYHQLLLRLLIDLYFLNLDQLLQNEDLGDVIPLYLQLLLHLLIGLFYPLNYQVRQYY